VIQDNFPARCWTPINQLGFRSPTTRTRLHVAQWRAAIETNAEVSTSVLARSGNFVYHCHIIEHEAGA